MNSPRWAFLGERDLAAFRAVSAFLRGRLEERATVDWALRLTQRDAVKRLALLDQIDSREALKIAEPWRSAWRLIEKTATSQPVDGHSSMQVIEIQHRVQAGDRSLALVSEIAGLVAPRLKVEAFSKWELSYRKVAKRPRRIQDLFSAGLTSSEVVDPAVVLNGALSDRSFLMSLANALDAAVTAGLDIARNIGWDGTRHLWQLGMLNRVYYVAVSERADGRHEPDEFHRGIAPAVKFLHFVVAKLVDIDTSAAIDFVRRWKMVDSPIHRRLWAALSRDSRVTPATEAGDEIASLDDRSFWNLHDYPEIAELRARRFGDFDPSQQTAIIRRIRKLPPRSMWPKNSETDRTNRARVVRAIREMRRIEIAGHGLPSGDKAWLDSRIGEVADLAQFNRIDDGFMETPKAYSVAFNADNRFDLLSGKERLIALHAALSAKRDSWDENSAESAAAWIRQRGNALAVIADLESTADAGASYSEVWGRLGWAYASPPEEGAEETQLDPKTEANRVLALMARLPDSTSREAIDGLSQWLSAWEKQVAVLPLGLTVWLKLWPLAVENTNARESAESEEDLNTVAQSSDSREPMDLDTLNTPAGKLVSVFLAACPSLQAGELPFEADRIPRIMRDAIFAAAGRSVLIARHRMIESLPYFLRADPEWSQQHLITPLVADNTQALALWRAIARRTQFTEVLMIIGGPMAERAVDVRLGRETRQSLVFSLIIECLHALKDNREPAVPYSRVQQMIRSLEDEVRAYGAGAIRRFVHDLSSVPAGAMPSQSPEMLFKTAAAPFLEKVWPQERSLTTPGVSRALADLPAAARQQFSEAVEAIERFLVPFDCWSMLDFGLYGEEDGGARLAGIDSKKKATSFLLLLDRTVGISESSVIPYDLAEALDQVRKVAPDLAETQIFRRLSAAARRS